MDVFEQYLLYRPTCKFIVILYGGTRLRNDEVSWWAHSVAGWHHDHRNSILGLLLLMLHVSGSSLPSHGTSTGQLNCNRPNSLFTIWPRSDWTLFHSRRLVLHISPRPWWHCSFLIASAQGPDVTVPSDGHVVSPRCHEPKLPLFSHHFFRCIMCKWN